MPGFNLVDILDDTMPDFFARLLAACILFLLGYLIAYAVKFAVRGLLQGCAKIIYRSLPSIGTEQAALRTKAIDLFASFLFWCVVVFFLATAAENLGLSLFSVWMAELISYLPRVLLAVAIVFFGILAGGFFKELITRGMEQAHLPHGRVLGQLTQFGTVAMSVVVAVGHVGVDLTVLVLLLAIVLAAALFGAALSFGLGARAMADNIIACYYVQKLYRVGDLVSIGPHRGIIVRITGAFVVVDGENGQTAIPAGDFARQASSLPKRGEEIS